MLVPARRSHSGPSPTAEVSSKEGGLTSESPTSCCMMRLIRAIGRSNRVKSVSCSASCTAREGFGLGTEEDLRPFRAHHRDIHLVGPELPHSLVQFVLELELPCLLSGYRGERQHLRILLLISVDVVDRCE